MKENKPRIQWISIGVPVVSLALAMGYVELRRGGAAPPSSGVSTDGQPGRVPTGESRRISLLEREVQLLRAAAREQSDDVERAQASPGERAPNAADEDMFAEEELTPAQRRKAREAQIAREQETRRQFLEELSVRVDNEPVDPAWRATTQEQLGAHFAEKLGTDVKVVATCASTLCRVQLAHPSVPHLPFEKLADLAMHRAPELGKMEMHYDEAREGATRVYMLLQPDDASEPDDG